MTFDQQFDRLFNDVFGESFLKPSNYPPHNVVELPDKTYAIQVALAGFTSEDVEITKEKNKLTISRKEKPPLSDLKYRIRGIANREFKLSFNLKPSLKIGTVSMENGLLNIPLEEIIPEEEKPFKIPINPRKILLNE